MKYKDNIMFELVKKSLEGKLKPYSVSKVLDALREVIMIPLPIFEHLKFIKCEKETDDCIMLFFESGADDNLIQYPFRLTLNRMKNELISLAFDDDFGGTRSNVSIKYDCSKLIESIQIIYGNDVISFIGSKRVSDDLYENIELGIYTNTHEINEYTLDRQKYDFVTHSYKIGKEVLFPELGRVKEKDIQSINDGLRLAINYWQVCHEKVKIYEPIMERFKRI